MRKIFLAFVLFVGFAAPASAEDAQALYAKGDYEAAIKAGEASGNAGGLILAARAALHDAKLRDTACNDCFKRVEALAARAVAADPKRPEGYIYQAAAMGLESHVMGSLATSTAGIPSKSKKLIDTAASLAPDSPLALVGLGGWNIEVIRVGGGIFGSLFYSASLDTGIKDFKKAVAIAPKDVIIRYEFALQLGAYDAKGQKAQIAAQLAAASAGDASTAYEKALQARAQRLSDLLAKNDMDDFTSLVRRYQFYPK